MSVLGKIVGQLEEGSGNIMNYYYPSGYYTKYELPEGSIFITGYTQKNISSNYIYTGKMSNGNLEMTINGKTFDNTSTNLYIPTTAGIGNGAILTPGNASNQAPQWMTAPYSSEYYLGTNGGGGIEWKYPPNCGATSFYATEQTCSIPIRSSNAGSSTAAWAMYLNIMTNYSSTVSTTGTVSILTSNAYYIISQLKAFSGCIYHSSSSSIIRVLGWGMQGISNEWSLIDTAATSSNAQVGNTNYIWIRGGSGSQSTTVVSWIETF